MSLIFVSGVSGTGKSTLMRELRKRGEEAIDMDTDCIRVSKVTGNVISYEEAKRDGYDWIYPKDALQKLKAEAATKDIFILGITDNPQVIQDAADKFVWMTIPLDVLVQRLDSRQKEYGKSERERKLILDQYNTLSNSLKPETFTLDATKPVETIADDLLQHVH